MPEVNRLGQGDRERLRRWSRVSFQPARVIGLGTGRSWYRFGGTADDQRLKQENAATSGGL
jgi:hypothetical protein